MPVQHITFVKLGGSLITDKTREYTARPDVIRRLARELHDAMVQRPELRVLLGHGSGSFGHAAARLYGTVDGASTPEQWHGMAQTAAAAARLNRLVADTCLGAGLPVMSLQPSASAMCEDGVLLWMANRPIEVALEQGLVPLVYGDVTFDSVRGCSIISTEQVFAYMAARLPVARIILAGVVDGVYDRDPLRQPGAGLIPRITPGNIRQVREQVGGSHGVDVTGGMLSKVATLYPLVTADIGLRVHFVSGETPGRLFTALEQDECDFGTVMSMA